MAKIVQTGETEPTEDFDALFIRVDAPPNPKMSVKKGVRIDPKHLEAAFKEKNLAWWVMLACYCGSSVITFIIFVGFVPSLNPRGRKMVYIGGLVSNVVMISSRLSIINNHPCRTMMLRHVNFI